MINFKFYFYIIYFKFWNTSLINYFRNLVSGRYFLSNLVYEGIFPLQTWYLEEISLYKPGIWGIIPLQTWYLGEIIPLQTWYLGEIIPLQTWYLGDISFTNLVSLGNNSFTNLVSLGNNPFTNLVSGGYFLYKPGICGK